MSVRHVTTPAARRARRLSGVARSARGVGPAPPSCRPYRRERTPTCRSGTETFSRGTTALLASASMLSVS